MVKSKKSLKIPKGGNQNSYIEKEQTTQWSKVRRVWRYQRGNQNRISKKNRQHNGQKNKDKKTNSNI
jgi:hypothetical protein